MAGNTAHLERPNFSHHLTRPLRNYLTRRYIEWLMWGLVEMYTAEAWSAMYEAYLEAGGTEARWNQLFDERTFDIPAD
jgi:hypothetical protein